MLHIFMIICAMLLDYIAYVTYSHDYLCNVTWLWYIFNMLHDHWNMWWICNINTQIWNIINGTNSHLIYCICYIFREYVTYILHIFTYYVTKCFYVYIYQQYVTYISEYCVIMSHTEDIIHICNIDLLKMLHISKKQIALHYIFTQC